MLIEVKINNVAYDCESNYDITQQAGATSTSNISVFVGAGQPEITTYMICEIIADSIPFFTGIIQSVSSPEFSSGYEVKKYKLQLQSLEVLLNNRLVSKAYVNKYTHEIILDVFNNYILPENISIGQISTTTQLYENYNCQYMRVYDLLSELASDVNATFFISPDKKFYFLLNDSFLQINAPTHIKDLKIIEETGELRTVQIISGANEETSAKTENVIWAANQNTITTGYQILSVTGITINGNPAGVGKLGVSEDDTTKTFLWQEGQNVITVNPNATIKPVTADNVVYIYTGYYQIIIENTNNSLKSEIQSISGTSGIIEKVLTDQTIQNYTDAEKKSLSLLNQYGERERTISCISHSLDDTKLFTVWDFNFPQFNIVGKYVVIERRISSFGVSDIKINIKLKNKNFFAKYATVLIKQPKIKNKELKVYVNATVGDAVTMTDNYDISYGNLLFYPVAATGSAMAEPIFTGYLGA